MNPHCQKLDDYLDGVLPSQQSQGFELHLERCPDCQRAVRFERMLSDAVREGAQRISVPAAIGDRVRERSKPRRRAALVLASAVCLALIPVLTFLLNRSEDSTPSAQLSPLSPSADPIQQPELPRRDETMAIVKGDERHIVVPVPTQSRQVTFVMLYPTVPRNNASTGGSAVAE